MSNQEFAKLWEDAIARYNVTVGAGKSIGDRTGPSRDPLVSFWK
jgi:hypothetical protein